MKVFRIGAVVAAAAVLVAGLNFSAGLFQKRVFRGKIAKAGLSALLERRAGLPAIGASRYETIAREKDTVQVEYTIDPHLQKIIEEAYRRAGVMYGAFVAIEPQTGKVLAMVSHGKRGANLALRSTFPAASIFKIVTAAAAIEAGKLTHNSLIPVLGSDHTLYKRNLFSAGGIDPERIPRYARLITFQDAMAKSVNSVFGKVGIFGIGSEGIRKSAARFAFNRDIPFELPVGASRAEIPNDLYGVAESASGFTKLNTMSPLHGAMLAAAVVNDGVIMEPAVVERVARDDGDALYSFEPTALTAATNRKTAEELRIMLGRTITNGTSRGSFRGATRAPALSGVFIGGKTGTLNGWDPPGRYDWFVGFAENGGSKLAVAALCVHGARRGMKASKVARKAFESYFRNLIALNGR
ncbi:MAG: penicillin-binding protein [Deltaproteobacteria bacterium]|nr:penicillin-binding protein [Deltaproteobacteria bacterium]